MQGWIKLHRCLIDKPIWLCSTPEQKAILITLLMMANHKEKEWIWQGKKYKCQPGEFVTSLKQIAQKSGTSIKNVRTALRNLEETYEFLANKSTNKNRLIAIVNWEFYQSQDNEVASKSASKWQASGKQVATNKNDKNDKKNNNSVDKDVEMENLISIMDMFNELCPSLKNVTRLTDKRKGQIRARLKDFSRDDLKKAFMMAEKSDFLSGRNGVWGGCNFDWLLNETNLVKVIEGSYENGNGKEKKKSSDPFPEAKFI